MIFRQTSELDKIEALHERIFIDEFPWKKFHKRLQKGQCLLPFLFYDEQESAVGYAIVVSQKPGLHLWLGGVLPHARGRGIMGRFFSFLEDFALQNGFDRITLNTDNRKTGLLRMALRHGFDILATGVSDYGDGILLCLRRRVTAPLNLRISLTRKCNYKCFFCHGEGVPGHVAKSLSCPEIESIIVQAGKLKLQTVTFTGGEPLLERECLLHGLEHCMRLGERPALKLVTNGALLDAELARQLAKYPGLAVNLSLHGADAATCKRITGSANAFDSAVNAAGMLAAHKVPFRLNTVLLRDVNDSPEQIGSLLKFALAGKIPQITFLELHAPLRSDHHLDFGAMREAALGQAKRMGRIQKLAHTARKCAYELFCGNMRLALNFFRLSCRSGCLECARHRDETIGPDGRLYPCFMSDAACGDGVANLYEAIERSRAFVQMRIREGFDPSFS